MSIAIVQDDRYLEHDPGTGHPESPNRLRVISALIESEFKDLPRVEPRLATHDELALVHDPSYIRRVAATEGRSSTRLDPDTACSARSYEAASLAAGGLLAAVDTVLGSSPSGSRIPNSAFAFVRPPGHHAEHDRAMGFCLFNNVAVAAAYARKKHGLERVLIVDWDLHHGNGTQWSFYDDPGVLFFSSHQYPYYPGSGDVTQTGEGAGEGYTVNAPFPTGFGDAEYQAVYSRVLRPIALEYRPQLVLVSAGFDPYCKDPLGGMAVTGAGFGVLASIVRNIADECCGGKVVITLEGGYNPDGLRDGVRAVLKSFQGPPPGPPVIPAAPQAERVIMALVNRHAARWTRLA